MHLFTISALLFSYFHLHFSASDTFFQKPWNCSKKVLNKEKIEIHCLVKDGQHWNITEFRKWTAPMLGKVISVHLKCLGTGSVSLTKPIKANGLSSIHVDGCIIRKYMTFDLSEEVYQIKDTLKVFETINCLHEINFQELLLSYKRDVDAKIRKMYPCEHNKYLQRFTERNMSYNLIGYETLTWEDKSTFNSEVDRSLYDRPKCEYPYLEYYEISNSQQDPKTSFNAIRYLVNNGKFPSLRVFNFSNLGLTNIPDYFYRMDWWVYLRSLEKLDLSNNNISTIRFQYSSSTSNKNSLHVDLRNNSLKILKENDIKKLTSFYPNTVNLRNNPFLCNCVNKDMITFLQKNINEDRETYYQYLNTTRCKERKYRGQLLIKMSVPDLCHKNILDNVNNVQNFISVYICVGFLIALALVVLLLFYFRTEIKILAYNRLFSGKEASSNEYMFKEFDAFVSYSAMDENWVMKCLCKRLEASPPNFKLCLHHKHFIPGACIADNIIESVEKSRHTIIVLSQNFLNSEWCLLEFRKAFHQSLIERNRHLIVIMMENVTETNIPLDMKHFLQTYTYLKSKESLFWDKLIFALSDRKKDICCGMKCDVQPLNDSKTSSHILAESS